MARQLGAFSIADSEIRENIVGRLGPEFWPNSYNCTHWKKTAFGGSGWIDASRGFLFGPCCLLCLVCVCVCVSFGRSPILKRVSCMCVPSVHSMSNAFKEIKRPHRTQCVYLGFCVPPINLLYVSIFLSLSIGIYTAICMNCAFFWELSIWGVFLCQQKKKRGTHKNNK